MAKINSLIENINDGENPLFQELYGTDLKTLKSQSKRYASLMAGI